MIFPEYIILKLDCYSMKHILRGGAGNSNLMIILPFYKKLGFSMGGVWSYLFSGKLMSKAKIAFVLFCLIPPLP